MTIDKNVEELHRGSTAKEDFLMTAQQLNSLQKIMESRMTVFAA